MSEHSFHINNLIIARRGNGESDEIPSTFDKLFPLPPNLISAQDLLYAQNHINYPSFEYRLNPFTSSSHHSREKVKHLLNEMIQIREVFLSVGGCTLLLRSLPEDPKLFNNEHRISNPERYLEKAFRDQGKPIQEREVYLIEDHTIPKRLSLNPTDPLITWLFLNQSDSLAACAKKHKWKDVLLYIPRVEQESYVRGLWITPMNDHRDPPAKEKTISIGAYRYGSEFIYTTHLL